MQSISLKQSSLASKILSRTGSLASGAVKSYFTRAIPNTMAIASGINNARKEVTSVVSLKQTSVYQSIKQMKMQLNTRTLLNWYIGEENSLQDDMNGFANDLQFDIPSDDVTAEISKVELSESSKNARDIQRSVVESSHKLAESQINATANIITAMSEHTSVISLKLDNINDNLRKFMDVFSKNTAALIETTALGIAKRESDPKRDLLNGRFNLKDYKKILSSNFQSSQLGLIKSMGEMLLNPSMLKMMLEPENLMELLFEKIMDKKAPNLKRNLKSMDKAIQDTFIDSLIRMGTNNNRTLIGDIGRLFGIDPQRKNVDRSRSSLELKQVPFDSIVHESITNAIPGYLRKILVQLGGKDEIYDYRSRSFRTSNQIKKEYMDISSGKGSLYNANRKIRNIMGSDGFGEMIYDLMMNDIGQNKLNESGRNLLKSFSNNPKAFRKYVQDTLMNNVKLTSRERARLNQISNNFSKSDPIIGRELFANAARNNLDINKKLQEFVDTANAFNIDLSSLNFDDNINSHLKSSYGRQKSNISTKNAQATGGVDYTNLALFRIFNRLDKGINVFQVGLSNMRNKPFESMKKLLPKPKFLKSDNQIEDSDNYNDKDFTSGLRGGRIHDDYRNPLRNNENPDGSSEDLNKWERFKRWTGDRGSKFQRALFSGDPTEIRDVIGLIFTDIQGIAVDQFKKSAININNQFGNVSGHLKHKLFGTEYTFQDGVDENGNPIIKRVKENTKGGMFGYVSDQFKNMFKSSTEKGKKWFDSVKGYFDYEGKAGDGTDKSVVNKRKKLIATSVGALTGAGLLGGPIGLIMGAVAGNALSGLDIGKKIKEALFGYDDNGKAKGLFTKLGEKVIDPIHYQISKTIHHFGNNMKKNILGPLSDIGLAIRNRIADTAESKFGKVFTTIGKWILAPFKGIGNIILKTLRAPITLAGMGARGLSSAVTGTAGMGLNSLASLIAGNSSQTIIDENGNEIIQSTKDVLKKRRKDRSREIKDGKFDNYKDWKNKKASTRIANKLNFDEYVAEDIEDISESVRASAEISESIARDTHTLSELGSEKGSIYTHDHGLHERLDSIIQHLTGRSYKPGANIKSPMSEVDNNGVIESAITSAAVLSAANEEVTSEEGRLTATIIDEATKNKPNKRTISAKLKELISTNSKAKGEVKEKKESFFDKILENLGNIGGILTKLLPLLGLLGLFSNGGNIKNMIENILQKPHARDEENDTPLDNGAQGFFNIFGSTVEGFWDTVNPFSQVYHTNRDAAGNRITDQEKTQAKQNYQLKIPLIQSIVDPNKVKASGVVGNVGKNYLKMGLIGLGASGLGAVVNKGAQAAGFDQQTSQYAGDVATSATTTGLMSHYAWKKVTGKKHFLDTATDNIIAMMKKFFNILADRFKSVDKLRKFGSKITSKFDDMFAKIMPKLTNEVAEKLAPTITKLTGIEVTKETASAFLAGLPIIAGAVSGFAAGKCGAEHLFQVSPGDADGIMTSISVIMKTVFGALEWVPVAGVVVAILDLIDKFVIKTIFGKSLEQTIAEFFYNLLKGDGGAALSQKQSALSSQRDSYNATYGADLNTDQFNDLVNNQGWLDRLIRGKAKYDKDGKLMFDEAGGRIDGGIRGSLYSSQGSYVKDASGKIVKDKYGDAIQNVNKLGLKNVKDKKWGDHLNDIAAGIGHKILGGNVYKTDAEGNAILDSNMKPIVDKVQGNIIEETGKSIKDFTSNVFKSSSELMESTFKRREKSKDTNKHRWADSNKPATLDEYLTGKVKDIQERLINTASSGLNSYFSHPMPQLALAGGRPTMGSMSMINNRSMIFNANSFMGKAIALGTSGTNSSSSDGLDYMRSKYARRGGPLDIFGGNPLSKEASLTSEFGFRGNEAHKGIDIIPKDQSHDANIVSTLGGRILSVKNNISNKINGLNYRGKDTGGNEVIIQRDDGLIAKNYHLKSGSIPSNIKPGTRVERGQFIGKMGSTGRSGGSHLHYQLEIPTKNGSVPINPLSRIGNVVKRIGNRIGNPLSEFQKWIDIIKKVKLQLASQKLGYSQSRFTNIIVDGITHKTRTDCSGFVSACVSLLRGKNILFYTGNQDKMMKDEGFIASQWPGWDKLYPGDVLMSHNNRSQHTEIFAYNEGNKHYVWNCGSNDSCNNPNPTLSSRSQYDNVYRLPSSDGQQIDPLNPTSLTSNILSSTGNIAGGGALGLMGVLSNLGNNLLSAITGGLIGATGIESNSSSINDSGLNANSSSYNNADITGNDVGDLWRYFRKLGYSEMQTAAVLGSWMAESGNNPKKVESDYTKPFKDLLTYDSIITDREATDKFTQEVFGQYDRMGLRIDRNAYKASDGHYYPGIGFSQWTGGRSKELIEFATKHGMKWYDGKAQLAFLDYELKNKKYYADGMEKFKAANNIDDAVDLFNTWYVGYHGPKRAERKVNARNLLNQYKDSSLLSDREYNKALSDEQRLGGPIDDYSYISNFNDNFQFNNVNNKPIKPVNMFNRINTSRPINISHKIEEKISNRDFGIIIEGLKTIINHLASINNNTGSSSSLLEDLNGKEFIDKGLRDTLSSMKPKNISKRPSSGNINSIQSLVRP